jgi:pSer/pThr/pTyr-binding forkhead associated (FHA) protein/predicted amidophosphoribosyltransferase
MITCPSCGAQNDDGNRFCDQCGTRLDAPAAATPPPATDQPTVAAQNCPNCGSPVMPGEAFCDNCGAALTPPAAAPAADPAAASADAPTMLAAPPAAAAAVVPPAATGTSAPGDVPMVVCAVCGHHNLPGEAFCDNCGAALTPAAHAADTVSPYAPTVLASEATATAAPDDATVVAPPAATPDDATVVAPPPTAAAPDDATVVAPPPTAAAPDDATVFAPPPVAPEATPPSLAPTEPIGAHQGAATPAVEPAADPAAVPAGDAGQAAYEAKRSELEAEIGRQEQIIAQFEQMQTMFGAATPPAVTQGLNEARDALARVQGELAALQPPAPPAPAVDPAEVARLEEEIARQQQIIAQFEQMQTMFGAATPPAVTQGLNEARDALARVEGELAALTGGAPAAAPPTATPAQSVAPVEAAPAIAPAAEAAAPVAPSVEAAAPPPAEAAPASPGPRLVLVEGGQVVVLPTDKTEIIIGREDPVSNIFPEVDLTPFGGENGGVSRQHARINRANGDWTITDLNSTNYTRVDGVRLDPTVPTPLKDGARVQFGRVAMMFHL